MFIVVILDLVYGTAWMLWYSYRIKGIRAEAVKLMALKMLKCNSVNLSQQSPKLFSAEGPIAPLESPICS